MTNNFITYDGEISIEDNCLQINDRQPKWLKLISLVSIISALLYGVLIIIKYFRTSDPFDLWPGITMVALGIPALVVQSKIIYDSRIDFKDIRRIIIRRNMSNHLIADIILHTGKKRRVMLDQEDLGRFERDHLDELTEVLSKKKLVVEVK